MNLTIEKSNLKAINRLVDKWYFDNIGNGVCELRYNKKCGIVLVAIFRTYDDIVNGDPTTDIDPTGRFECGLDELDIAALEQDLATGLAKIIGREIPTIKDMANW